MSSGPPLSRPHKRDRIPRSSGESAAHRARCSSSFLLLSLGSGLRRPLAWIRLRNGEGKQPPSHFESPKIQARHSGNPCSNKRTETCEEHQNVAEGVILRRTWSVSEGAKEFEQKTYSAENQQDANQE